PSFSFSGYQEASIFLDNVTLRVPKKIQQYLFLPCSPPIQYIRILDSTFPDDAKNKKISSYSRYLGTATDIPQNGLFVNHFPDLKVDSVSQTTSENYCNNIFEKTNEPIQADEIVDSLEKDNHENTVTNEIDGDNFNEDSMPETEEDVISSIIETRSIGHDMPISDKTDTSVNDNVHGMEVNITSVNLSNTETQLVTLQKPSIFLNMFTIYLQYNRHITL
ncbi:21236_t:CDS:2, partial [Rhizophagus irregularis]